MMAAEDAAPNPLLAEIAELDVDDLTPRQALDILASLRDRARGGSTS